MKQCIVWMILGFFMMVMTGCGEFTKKVDVQYGSAAGQKLLMDIYQPTEKISKLRAAVITLHGGGWSAGDKAEDKDLAEALAGQGYVVFAVNYRLVKERSDFWPAQLDDVQRAVRWVRANAAKYGIDPERLGAVGGSAGGHLVACLATMDTRDNSDPALAAYSSRPTCVVNMIGPTDMTDDFSKKVVEGEWTMGVVKEFLGRPKDFMTVAKSASPLFYVDKKSSPALILMGDKDPIVPVDHGVRFAEALKAAGVEASLTIFKGGHGPDDVMTMLDLMSKMNAFLKKHLRK